MESEDIGGICSSFLRIFVSTEVLSSFSTIGNIILEEMSSFEISLGLIPANQVLLREALDFWIKKN
jgi:hypothetical protein